MQAIRLRNALDPKRFYKGGNKDKGMPKYAQVSTVWREGVVVTADLSASPAARSYHLFTTGTSSDAYARREGTLRR